jgi:hypothetical protein
MTVTWSTGTIPTADKFNDPILETVTFTVNYTKPASPDAGDWYYNSDQGYFEYYNGSTWITII